MTDQPKFLSLLAVTTLLTFSCNQMQHQENAATDSIVTTEVNAAANKPVAQQPATTTDKNKLEGNWTRTDAPYQLKISELMADMSMKVEYFNPKSIKVGKANCSSADGVQKIYVELRDENYPGSHYTLYYYADKDMLVGQYFQAVEGTTYDVGFVRTK